MNQSLETANEMFILMSYLLTFLSQIGTLFQENKILPSVLSYT